MYLVLRRGAALECLRRVDVGALGTREERARRRELAVAVAVAVAVAAARFGRGERRLDRGEPQIGLLLRGDEPPLAVGDLPEGDRAAALGLRLARDRVEPLGQRALRLGQRARRRRECLTGQRERESA